MTGRIRKVPLYYSFFSYIYLFFVRNFQSRSSLIVKSANVKYMSLLNKGTIIYPSHVAMPLTRKIMYYLENNYKNEFIITGKSKFRSCTDLRITYMAANYTNFVSFYGKDKKYMGLFNYKKINCIKDQFLTCINVDESVKSHLELRKFFQEKHNIIY